MTLFPDDSFENQDWTKQSWDFPEVRTRREFEEWLDTQGMSVEKLMKLPVYTLAREKYPFLRPE